jgi:hypothetical protein
MFNIPWRHSINFRRTLLSQQLTILSLFLSPLLLPDVTFILVILSSNMKATFALCTSKPEPLPLFIFSTNALGIVRKLFNTCSY